MTLPSLDPRRADAHARWLSADTLALRPEAAGQLAEGPVHLAGWMDEEDDEEDPGYEIEDGVAVIRIEGALMDRGACWWWDTYESIAARVEAAHEDPNARALLFDVDSPGGMVSGLFDAMRTLRAAKAKSGKRCVAWVGSGAFSAAFGLVSTCDEIVLSDTAGTGSVGVITSLSSYAEMLKKNGVDVRVVSSGTEKTDGHSALPISKGAEERARARVEELAALLFAEVGAGRETLTADALTALDGGVRYGRAAIAAGLADRISTRAELLAELKARVSSASPSASSAPMTFAPRPGANTTRNTMHEALAALIAAKTGETDPERQLGALQAMFSKADAHDALAAELGAQRAKAEAEGFEREIAAGLSAKKLSEAEAAWWREERAAGRATAASLNANLTHRAAPSLPAADPAHVALAAPSETPRAAAASPRAAELLAKPYASLSWDERNELARVAPEAHERVYAAWVDAGRPKA